MCKTKKIVLLLLTAIVFMSFTACNLNNKESVSVKESEMYKEFDIEKTQIKEENVFSKDGITVSLKNISYGDVETALNFDIKNDTDKKIKVVTSDFSVNGLMCLDAMMTDVNERAQKQGKINISNEWLYDMGIKSIADIEYIIKIYDENNEEILSSDILKVKTDAPWHHSQSYDKDGVKIYNKGGLLLSVKNIKKSSHSNDTEIVFYAENNTDRTISIMATEVFVNKKPIEPVFVITVGPKKKAVDSMLFYESDLSSAQISEITSVNAKFKAVNDSLETVFETENVEIPVK